MKTIRLHDTEIHDALVYFPANPEKRVVSFFAKSPGGKTSALIELSRTQLDSLSEILERAERISTGS